MIKNEIRPLTGIRGLAALWVVCFHFESDILRLVPGLSVFHPFLFRGGLGVDIFFVLSGFVIATVYKIDAFKTTLASYGNFLVNRIARIYPDYLFCFLVLAAMVFADHVLGKHTAMVGKHLTDPAEYPVSSVGFHLVMMQAWPFVPAHWDNWNAPAWSDSAEWFAYLFLFPFSVWLASIALVRKFSPALVFVLMASFVAINGLGTTLHGFYFVSQITAEFISGSLVYLFCRENPGVIKMLASRMDLVILAFLALVWFSLVSMVSYWLIILMAPIIIAGLTQESSIFAKILATPFVCYLGRVSYALYLIHAIAQRMLHILLPVDRYAADSLYVRFAVLLAYFVFPLLLAMGIYHVIEEPSRLVIRQWCKPKLRAPVEAIPAPDNP